MVLDMKDIIGKTYMWIKFLQKYKACVEATINRFYL